MLGKLREGQGSFDWFQVVLFLLLKRGVFTDNLAVTEEELEEADCFSQLGKQHCFTYGFCA